MKIMCKCGLDRKIDWKLGIQKVNHLKFKRGWLSKGWKKCMLYMNISTNPKVGFSTFAITTLKLHFLLVLVALTASVLNLSSEPIATTGCIGRKMGLHIKILWTRVSLTQREREKAAWCWLVQTVLEKFRHFLNYLSVYNRLQMKFPTNSEWLLIDVVHDYLSANTSWIT